MCRYGLLAEGQHKLKNKYSIIIIIILLAMMSFSMVAAIPILTLVWTYFAFITSCCDKRAVVIPKFTYAEGGYSSCSRRIYISNIGEREAIDIKITYSFTENAGNKKDADNKEELSMRKIFPKEELLMGEVENMPPGGLEFFKKEENHIKIDMTYKDRCPSFFLFFVGKQEEREYEVTRHIRIVSSGGENIVTYSE